jgi:hypothetical protein
MRERPWKQNIQAGEVFQFVRHAFSQKKEQVRKTEALRLTWDARTTWAVV